MDLAACWSTNADEYWAPFALIGSNDAILAPPNDSWKTSAVGKSCCDEIDGIWSFEDDLSWPSFGSENVPFSGKPKLSFLLNAVVWASGNNPGLLLLVLINLYSFALFISLTSSSFASVNVGSGWDGFFALASWRNGFLIASKRTESARSKCGSSDSEWCDEAFPSVGGGICQKKI
jgi:hypothetical protein